MKRAALLPLLLLWGCAAPQMTAGSVPSQQAADDAICRGEVQKAALANGGPSISVVGAIAWRDAYVGCMVAKGYSPR